MSGAGFILAINLFVAGLLAAAFLTIAAYDRRRESARWLALGYIVGMSNFLFEFAIATFGTSIRSCSPPMPRCWPRSPSSMSASRANIRCPCRGRSMAVVFVVSVVTCYLIKDMPRQSFMRMLLYQSPYFIMQAIAVGIVAPGEGAQLRSTMC